MIQYKTPKEIKTMQKCGEILKAVMAEVVPQIEPGMTTLKIDELVQTGIKKRGGDLSFNKVDGYKWAICASVNNQLVHTPPSKYVLKNGDVLTIDIGVYFEGYHTDHAITFIVGTNDDPKLKTFLNVGKVALEKALKEVIVGNYVGDVSRVFQTEIENAGYSIVKRLTGHGIGKELHEEPYVPCFVSKPRTETTPFKPGMVVAIEVMYAMGSGEMMHEPGNHWSIATSDGSISAQFEHTIAVLDKNTLILT